MAFKSDAESSTENGSNAQGGQPNSPSSTSAVAGSSASQEPERQSDSEPLSYPEDWAGHQAVLEAGADGMNLSDFLPSSDSDSRDTPIRSPARPVLTRLNSNGPQPQIVRRSSMERVVTTRNMMNSYAEAQRTTGQRPNGHSVSSYMNHGAMAPHATVDNVHQSFGQEPVQQPLMQPYLGIGGYAGISVPSAIMGPSNSYAPAVISGQASAMMPSTDGGIKLEPIDFPPVAPQGFDITVDQSTNPKETSYKWSPYLNRLYIDWKRMVAFTVHLPQATGVYLLRAKFVYKDTYAPIDRCADCRHFPGEDPNSPEHSHIVRFGGNSAQYLEPSPGQRYTENRIEFADDGSSVTRTAIQFSCRNSCDRANRNRERVLILELVCIDSHIVIGVKELSVRVCASPTRDYENDVQKATKQRRLSRKSPRLESLAEGSSSEDQQPAAKKAAKRQDASSGTTTGGSRMMTADFVHNLREYGRYMCPPPNASPGLREAYYYFHKCATFYQYCKDCHPDVTKLYKREVYKHLKPTAEVPISSKDSGISDCL